MQHARLSSRIGAPGTLRRMYDLILVRHGRSEWNEKNLFTGWYDCPLIEKGRDEARAAGPMLVDADLLPDVVHTSLQQRAIETAELMLAGCDRRWIPVRRSWRLNERHYGDLTGLDKAATREKHGDEQLHIWRRSFDTPPPPISDDNPYNPNTSPAYADLPPELLPLTECLKDVVERMLPYWFDGIVPDLRAGRNGARRRPRKFAAGPRQAPRHDPRRRDRRAEHPHRDAAPLRARRRHAAARGEASAGAGDGPRGGRRGRRRGGRAGRRTLTQPK